MKKIRLLGDIHGMITPLKKAYKTMPENSSLIQLGDFGWGPVFDYLNKHPDFDIKFIHGNHEKYHVLPEYKQYLGKFGYMEDLGIFYVSGAWSIDKSVQMMYGVWSELEELTREELESAVELYSSVKPKIVISHTAPMEIAQKLISPLFGNKYYGNRTEDYLQTMFELHQPEKWFFGHWHMSYEEINRGTQFKCLNIDEFVDIEV